MRDKTTETPIVAPGMVWSHAPDGRRDEGSVYRLPRNEVLPFLAAQTSFLKATSSPVNDQAREVICREQYPQLHGPIDPLAPRPDWSASDLEREVSGFVERYAARRLESRPVKVGYTPVLPEHVYTDGVVTLPHAIVLGLPMRYDETNAAPEPRAGEEVTVNYMELGGLTLALGRWLRERGYSAEVHHPRGDESMTCEALFIPHAIAAGLGDLGRHGSMISRELGPRIRLAMVTSDAPIPAASKPPIGVAEFCTWCTRCVTACPVDAVPETRTTLRGSYRFIVDTNACLPYFAETDGCGICIAVCPYNRPTEDDSARFVDRVLDLGWVRRGRAIGRTEGIEAMERYVADEKAARRTR
jgi:ferredoxin